MMPTHQRFKSDDFVGENIDLRLIIKFQLIFGDHLSQIDFQSTASLCYSVHLFFEETKCAASIEFSPIESEVRVFDQLFFGVAVSGGERDADADAGDDLLSVKVNRLTDQVQDARCHR